MAVEHVARSSGGATMAMDPARPDTPAARPGLTRARWTGGSDRARLLQGLATDPRIVGTRR
jgi:hypothetical protein